MDWRNKELSEKIAHCVMNRFVEGKDSDEMIITRVYKMLNEHKILNAMRTLDENSKNLEVIIHSNELLHLIRGSEASIMISCEREKYHIRLNMRGKP